MLFYIYLLLFFLTKSLERMVVGFAKDHLHLSDEDLSLVASNVREGDISILLREYEKEIKVRIRATITHL